MANKAVLSAASAPSFQRVPFSATGAVSDSALDDLEWEDDITPLPDSEMPTLSDSESDSSSHLDESYFTLNRNIIRVHVNHPPARATTPLDEYFKKQAGLLDRKSIFRKIPTQNSETNLTLVGNHLIATQLRCFINGGWQPLLAKVACGREELSAVFYHPKTGQITDSKSSKADLRSTPNYGTRVKLMVNFLTHLTENRQFISWFFLSTVYFKRHSFLPTADENDGGEASNPTPRTTSSLPDEMDAIVLALLQWQLPEFDTKTTWSRLELAKDAIRKLNPVGRMAVVLLMPPNKINGDAIGKNSPAMRRFDFWTPVPDVATAAEAISSDRLGFIDYGKFQTPQQLNGFVLVSTGLRWDESQGGKTPEKEQSDKFCESMRTRRIKRSLFYLPTESPRLANQSLPPKPVVRRPLKMHAEAQGASGPPPSAHPKGKSSLFLDARRKYERERLGLKDRKRKIPASSS